MMEESKGVAGKTGPEAGKKLDQSRSNWLLWLMPITGFFALLWFLIRVIPKPSRAAYPCQRVAFPIASAFVIWMTGLVGSAVAMRKARVLVKDRRFLSALFFVTVAIMAISLPLTYHAPLSIADDGSYYDPFDSVENSPLDPKGDPAGIHPGRVVWNYNPNATRNVDGDTWDGSTGYWKNYIDQAEVDQMLSESLLDLVKTSMGDTSSESDAWDQIFKYHNGGTGYVAGQKIAIKLNLNRSPGYTGDNNAGLVSPQIVLALLRQLVNNAGFDDDDITFYDVTKQIPDHTFDRCVAEFPDVHFVDKTGTSGRELAVIDFTEQIIWADDLLDPTEAGTDPIDMYLPTCVTGADYFINLGSLKGHSLAGITGGAKNHFGTFIPGTGLTTGHPQKAGVHPYIAVHDFNIGNPTWEAYKRPMGSYNPLVDLMGHEHLGGKTILYLLDGFYAAHSQNSTMDAGNKWQTRPFGDSIGTGTYGWSSCLLASQDPVAIESVALDFLRNEPAVQGSDSLDEGDTVDNYLHEAAEADSSPSGYVYDPEGDGTPLGSLGVHEHWNNEFKRQYTGNLKTAPGIELIRSPRAWGDINGGGVNSEDQAIITANLGTGGCNPSNDWCNGADINQDGFVDSQDEAIVTADLGKYDVSGTYSYQVTVIGGTGGGVFPHGSTVPIVADSAPTGYEFLGWDGDVAYLADASAMSTMATILNGDIEVTAIYSTDYLLTVNNGTGTDYYAPGEPVVISATPPAGFEFDFWMGDVAYLADPNASTTTVTMPSANVEVTAVDKPIPGGGGPGGVLYEDNFDGDGLADNSGGTGGGMLLRQFYGTPEWTDNDGISATFVSSGTAYQIRGMMYSENAFQSDSGFKLTVNYTTTSLGSSGDSFAWGLVSNETDLSTYNSSVANSSNPIGHIETVYSLGVNLTVWNKYTRGLTFVDGVSDEPIALDESGTNQEFILNASTPVVIEFDGDGNWSYSINGIEEASGTHPGGFDLTKSYHVVVYGQDDNSAKSVQSIKLETLSDSDLDSATGPSPGNNATGVSSSAQLSWTRVNEPNVIQHVYFGTSRGSKLLADDCIAYTGATPDADQQNIDDSHPTTSTVPPVPSPLLMNTEYFWYVETTYTIDDEEVDVYSPQWSFTTSACPAADFNDDCTVDIDDLQLMAYDWLIEGRPRTMHWDFDMSEDPVGDGPFDLMVRDGGTTDLYRMADGKMIFDSGITNDTTVIENKHQYSKYDMEYHYVARSLDDRKFHLWVDIQSAAVGDDLRCFVGNSITRIADPGNPGEYIQEVIIWDGNPWGNSGNEITGLDPDAFITIDVDIYYETQTLDYTVSQLGSVVDSGSISYIASSSGTSPGGEFAFQCGMSNVGHAEVDHLTATIYGENPEWNPDPTYWHSDYDIAPVGSPDGEVNLLDFAVLADEWLD